MTDHTTQSPEPLPRSFIWRGIRLDRVVTRERIGGGIYDFGLDRGTVERDSKPPVFSATVGIMRYQLELQSDDSWVGKILIGGASNVSTPTYADPFTALDFAAEWWAAVVTMIPARPSE